MVDVRVLRELALELRSEGYQEGSPAYEREMRRRKVDMCKEMKGMESCSGCEYFDHCNLLKAHVRDMYKVPDNHE